MVFHHGKMVARAGKPLFTPAVRANKQMMQTMRVKPFGMERLRIPADTWRYPVIEIVPNQILTKSITDKPTIEDAAVIADPRRGLLKLVVVERHHETGAIGLGLVKGFGIKQGALASSIAHDSHNIIAVGTNEHDLFTTIKKVEALGGGLVVVADGTVLGALPLPIAGLLSDQPLENVVANLQEVERSAASLGSMLTAPFATLSFLALPVLPELRLTDRGLVMITPASTGEESCEATKRRNL